MLGKVRQLKSTTLLVFFLWLVKSLKNLQIIGLLITERNVFFPNFQYGFRSSSSTPALQTVVSDRIARTFIRYGVTRALALDISQGF